MYIYVNIYIIKIIIDVFSNSKIPEKPIETFNIIEHLTPMKCTSILAIVFNPINYTSYHFAENSCNVAQTIKIKMK